MRKLTELAGMVFRWVGLAFAIARNLLAYTIAVFVLFGVPYFLGQLVWASPVTGSEFNTKIYWLLILWALWYVFLRLVMAPLWFVSWGNAAMLLDNILAIYERITGRRVDWRY